jgi:hypothetical protein
LKIWLRTRNYVQRSILDSARRTFHVPLPAISSFGGLRTPAPGVRGAVIMGPASENLHKTGPPSNVAFDPNVREKRVLRAGRLLGAIDPIAILTS